MPPSYPALVYQAPGTTAVETFALPEPAPHEALIRLRACGICGSDIHRIYHGTAEPGVVLGHEWIGEVVQVGADVTQLKLGDRVIPGNGPGWPGGPLPTSPNDPPAPSSNLTGARARHSPRDNGRNCLPQTNRQGGFAHYTLRRWWEVGRVPSDLGDAAAACCEPLAVAVHAVQKAAVRLGDSVAVIGLGPIGLFVVQCAMAQGATRVIALDPNPHRRAVARGFGPQVVPVDPTKGDPLDSIVSLAGGNGPDVAFECAGAPDTLQLALESVTFGGRVCMVALRWTGTPVTPVEWLGRQPTLMASYAYGTNGWATAIDLLRLGVVRFESLTAAEDVFPFSRIQEALERARDTRGNAIKVLVDMTCD